MLTSIPSPSPEWQSFNLSEWLRSIGLAWFPGEVTIHMYALCILAGIVVAALLTGYRLQQRGVDSGYVIDVSCWAVLFGLVFARAFHVISHPADYFGPGADFFAVFRIWEGGIAIFGALIGGALGIWIACRVIGLRFSTFVDALAPGLLIAQAMGRVGNYFNHELFGVPTALPWGLQIEASNPAYPVGLPDGLLFHPTFLYEVIWNLLGAALLIWIDRKRDVQWGKLIALYLIWYGAGRAVWETIRIDPSEVFFGVRTNVWMAFAAILLGVVIWIVQRRRHTGLEPSPWQQGRQPQRKDAVDSEVYAEFDEADTQAESAATDTQVATK